MRSEHHGGGSGESKRERRGLRAAGVLVLVAGAAVPDTVPVSATGSSPLPLPLASAHDLSAARWSTGCSLEEITWLENSFSGKTSSTSLVTLAALSRVQCGSFSTQSHYKC